MADIRSVTEIFGENVFNETVMKGRLPRDTYKALKKTLEEGEPLERSTAQIVANAMKDWAIEKGATHYTHWFQPMTGITAEKHDAFISPADGGKVVMEFSGKELIKGEPDASSFPSGGLRATFEARGYTAWDPTSYAFVKDHTLYIPTAFCSYSGEALDNKTPLLRSMAAINKQVMRILRLFGSPATGVQTTVGAEQEYFLIDKELCKRRKDLSLAGRTLFGAMPAKGQELGDHYFGNLKENVSAFMRELDAELWRLGVLSKTKHNEVAPAQHELAPLFTSSNIASDHNQLTMELAKKIAGHHGLVCILHEKPFAGVNGSGKHNNWSISTNLGENLFYPGKVPEKNKQFLLLLAAFIKAVDEYSDLIRVSVASAGNDWRLGSNEAPPGIVSIFLGSPLTAILEKIANGEELKSVNREKLDTKVSSIPAFKRDASDRNRTSPLAFTGNKFEFRMVGSSQSISAVNTVLNTIMADVLEGFANRLEFAVASKFNVKEEIIGIIPSFGNRTDIADIIENETNLIIRDVMQKHRRIIFNGNNYSHEWYEEAKKRGLLNISNSVDAIPAFINEKNVALFEHQGIFTKQELHSRYEIYLENYVKTLHIEALTMIEMVQREILPACLKYSKNIFSSYTTMKNSGLNVSLEGEEQLCLNLSNNISKLIKNTAVLESLIKDSDQIESEYSIAIFYRDIIIPAMGDVRKAADELETIVGAAYWPIPTYTELMFNV